MVVEIHLQCWVCIVMILMMIMIMMMIIIIIRPHSVHKMQHIATDRVAWAVSFLFVVFVNPAKMVEPIDMPFGRG